MSSRIDGLLARIKQSRLAAAQPPVEPRPRAAGNGFPLCPERRGENLRLLRAFLNNPPQTDLAEALGLGSQSNYSSVERGEKPLTAAKARRIEKDLDLPGGWLERNNADSLFLSPEELDLVLELRRSSVEATLSLTSVVQAIRQVRK